MRAPSVLVLFAAALPLLAAEVAAQTTATARADSLLAVGDTAAAVAAYRAVLDADSTVGVAWYRMGVVQARRGEHAASVEALRRSLALGGPAAVRFELARAHAELGHADSAAHWIRQSTAAGYGTVQQVDTVTRIAGIATPVAQELRAAADRLVRPCEYDDRTRQFDFWLGDWEVTNSAGALQGSNRIEKISSGCILLESWKNALGVPGHSINYYDGVLGKYVQVWVGSDGSVIHVEGEVDDTGVMVFEGEIRSLAGARTPFRGRWSTLDDGRVRQFLETSADGGNTWSVWFDGYYRRVGAGG